jgi:hypothetical protein
MGHMEKSMIQDIEYCETSGDHKKRGESDFHLIFERGEKEPSFFLGVISSFLLTSQLKNALK